MDPTQEPMMGSGVEPIQCLEENLDSYRQEESSMALGLLCAVGVAQATVEG